MKVSLEYLYHYLCDRCQKWWTCADIKPAIGKEVYCPHCGSINKVEAIESFEINSQQKEESQMNENEAKLAEENETLKAHLRAIASIVGLDGDFDYTDIVEFVSTLEDANKKNVFAFDYLEKQNRLAQEENLALRQQIKAIG